MILKRIKQRLLIHKQRKKTNSVISRKCILNDETILEGHNKIGQVNISSCTIGYATYVLSGNLSNGVVGKFCSIGNNVRIVDATHPIDYVSSFPGFYLTENKSIFLAKNKIKITEHLLCSNGKSFVVGN